MVTKKRSTCIVCNSKRFQEHLKQFSFSYWSSPLVNTVSYHFACKDNGTLNSDSCYTALYRRDYCVVIMPYSKNSN